MMRSYVFLFFLIGVSCIAFCSAAFLGNSLEHSSEHDNLEKFKNVSDEIANTPKRISRNLDGLFKSPEEFVKIAEELIRNRDIIPLKKYAPYVPSRKTNNTEEYSSSYAFEEDINGLPEMYHSEDKGTISTTEETIVSTTSYSETSEQYPTTNESGIIETLSTTTEEWITTDNTEIYTTSTFSPQTTNIDLSLKEYQTTTNVNVDLKEDTTEAYTGTFSTTTWQQNAGLGTTTAMPHTEYENSTEVHTISDETKSRTTTDNYVDFFPSKKRNEKLKPATVTTPKIVTSTEMDQNLELFKVTTDTYTEIPRTDQISSIEGTTQTPETSEAMFQSTTGGGTTDALGEIPTESYSKLHARPTWKPLSRLEAVPKKASVNPLKYRSTSTKKPTTDDEGTYTTPTTDTTRAVTGTLPAVESTTVETPTALDDVATNGMYSNNLNNDADSNTAEEETSATVEPTSINLTTESTTFEYSPTKIKYGTISSTTTSNLAVENTTPDSETSPTEELTSIEITTENIIFNPVTIATLIKHWTTLNDISSIALEITTERSKTQEIDSAGHTTTESETTISLESTTAEGTTNEIETTEEVPVTKDTLRKHWTTLNVKTSIAPGTTTEHANTQEINETEATKNHQNSIENQWIVDIITAHGGVLPDKATDRTTATLGTNFLTTASNIDTEPTTIQTTEPTTTELTLITTDNSSMDFDEYRTENYASKTIPTEMNANQATNTKVLKGDYYEHQTRVTISKLVSEDLQMKAKKFTYETDVIPTLDALF